MNGRRAGPNRKTGKKDWPMVNGSSRDVTMRAVNFWKPPLWLVSVLGSRRFFNNYIEMVLCIFLKNSACYVKIKKVFLVSPLPLLTEVGLFLVILYMQEWALCYPIFLYIRRRSFIWIATSHISQWPRLVM